MRETWFQPNQNGIASLLGISTAQIESRDLHARCLRHARAVAFFPQCSGAAGRPASCRIQTDGERSNIKTHMQTVLLTGHGDAVTNAPSTQWQAGDDPQQDGADLGHRHRFEIALIKAHGRSVSCSRPIEGVHRRRGQDRAALARVPTTQEIVDYAQRVRAAFPVRTNARPVPDAQVRIGVTNSASWHVRPRFDLCSLNDEIIKRLNLKQSEGVLVTHVIKGLPAAVAGLMADDVVVTVNGKSVPQTKVFGHDQCRYAAAARRDRW